MLSINYNNLEFADVNKATDLFNEPNLKDSAKIRSMYGAVRGIFGLSQNVYIQVAKEAAVYKYVVISNKKVVLGWIIYIPGVRQLDIYDALNPGLPYVQYKGKNIAYQGFSNFLGGLGIEKLFSRLVDVI